MPTQNIHYMKRKYIYILIWTALIIYASLNSGEYMPKIPLFPHIDKVVHFCMYFGQSFLFVPLFSKIKNKILKYSYAFIASSLFGFTMEFFQYYFTKTRSGDLFDAIANASGALLGCLFYLIFFDSKRIEKIIFKE